MRNFFFNKISCSTLFGPPPVNTFCSLLLPLRQHLILFVTFQKVGNTERGIFDQSSLHNLSRSPRVLGPLLSYDLLSSAHTAGFLQDLGLGMDGH